MKIMKFDEYLTIGQAARFLGVVPATLRNWDMAGKLKSYRHPVNNYRLYKREELELLLKNNYKLLLRNSFKI